MALCFYSNGCGVMNYLPHPSLQFLMRENMTREKYQINQLWRVYEEIMRRDGIIENYKPMTFVAFQRRMNEFSSVDCSWLIKDGHNKAALYYLRACHRNNLSLDELKYAAMNLYNKGKSLWPL